MIIVMSSDSNHLILLLLFVELLLLCVRVYAKVNKRDRTKWKEFLVILPDSHSHPHPHPHTEGKLSFCGPWIFLHRNWYCEVQISKLKFCSGELDLHFTHTKTKLRLPQSLESRSSFHKRLNNSEGHKIPTLAWCMRRRIHITYTFHTSKQIWLSNSLSIQSEMEWIVERLSYQNSIWISIIVVRYKIQCMFRWMCARVWERVQAHFRYFI